MVTHMPETMQGGPSPRDIGFAETQELPAVPVEKSKRTAKQMTGKELEHASADELLTMAEEAEQSGAQFVEEKDEASVRAVTEASPDKTNAVDVAAIRDQIEKMDESSAEAKKLGLETSGLKKLNIRVGEEFTVFDLDGKEKHSVEILGVDSQGNIVGRRDDGEIKKVDQATWKVMAREKWVVPQNIAKTGEFQRRKAATAAARDKKASLYATLPEMPKRRISTEQPPVQIKPPAVLELTPPPPKKSWFKRLFGR